MRASNSGAMLDIVDVCSLLYRLQLEDVDIGDRWQAVYQVTKSHLHDHVLAFNDMHILLSCLGADQRQSVAELMASIEEFVKYASICVLLFNSEYCWVFLPYISSWHG